MIKEGAIGLAFKLFIRIFLVVWILEVVAKRVVIRIYARTSERY